MTETIFALATARGKAGVAVVRVSGPDAHAVVRRLCGDLPAPRRAALRRIENADGEILDEALVLVFAEGSSFTGEAVAEFHLHGSVAVIRSVMAALEHMDGLRLAEAGEFTRRALRNGRLDLTQIEGLADLIDAETEAQRRLAQRVFSGALGERAERWRSGLVRVAALLESAIDFADEDLPPEIVTDARTMLGDLAAEWRAEISGVGAAELIRDGFEVAIVGPPNAGKSTLLNRIAGRDVAITSEVAGTTRDVLEVRLDLGGLSVTLLDTAGLRESADQVEALGVARSRARAENADLRIFLSAEKAQVDALKRDGDLVASGKADLGAPGGLAVSGVTGAGIDDLLRTVQEVLGARVSGSLTATHARHRVALSEACEAAQAAAHLLAESDGVDLAAAEVRSAIQAMDALVGRVDVEDVLDHIFASFCIGK